MKKILPFIALLLSCNATRIAKTQQLLPAFDTEGHRGARGLMPENTIPAMLRAIDEGVTTLELDLHISKDRQVVVSHDPYFNELISTTPEGKYLTKEESRKRLLFQMPYDSIRRYDVGLKPHPDFPQQQRIAVYKPLLSDLITEAEKYAAAQGKTMWYNMEIKSKEQTDGVNHPAIPEFVDLVIAVLKEKNLLNRTIIQSFDPRSLRYLHQQYPAVLSSFLIEAKDKGTLQQYIDRLGFTPPVLSPNSALVTPELIGAAHKLGIKVVPWTVNQLEEMKKLKAMGVDGIISDYPNLFRQL